MQHSKSLTYLILVLTCQLLSNNTAIAQSYTDSEKIFVTTDRHVYTPGERLAYTVFVVDESHKVQQLSSMVKILLVDSKDKAIDSVVSHIFNGRFSYFFMLPATGGIYKIKASTRWQLNDKKPVQFQKDIYVQAVIQKKFFIKQTLTKTNYQTGDSVENNIHITKRGDLPIAGGNYTATLILDGEEQNSKYGNLDNNGKAQLSFVLPHRKIEAAYIKLESVYQGQSEYEMVRIPIQTNAINLVVHTEMGTDYLVANVPNRVIIESYDDLGNPKDISGMVQTESGVRISSFKSYHKGMAELVFTPSLNETYYVTSKATKTRVKMPLVKTNAPYIKVLEKSGNLVIESFSKKAHKVQVIVSGNGKVFLNKLIEPQIHQEKSQVQISLASLPAGVYGISYQNPNGDSYGNRLYIRRPEAIDINLKNDKEIVSLGKEVTVKLNTNNEAASYAIRVISEQVFKQMKDRSHSIVSWMYMGSEILGEIEEPTFYFDENETKANKALDLLGIVHRSHWRRHYNTGKVEHSSNHFYPRLAGQLSGTVYQYYHNKANVDKVKVRLKNTSYEVLTDSVGRFNFNDLPANVINGTPTLIISKGIERLEFPIQKSYNFYNYSFAESVNLKALSNQNKRINSIVTAKESSSQLRYTYRPGFYDGVVTVGADRMAGASYSIDAMSVQSSYLTSSDVWKYSGVYMWQFGIADGTFQLYNSEGNGYTVPYGVTLNYQKYRPNVASYPGPIRLSDKTTFWFGESASNSNGDSKQNFFAPHKNDGLIIFCEGVTASGKVFVSSKSIQVQDEVEIFTNVPTSLTAGDYANVELRCINHTAEPKTLAYVIMVNKDKNEYTLDLGPNESKNVYVDLTTGNKNASIQFQYTYGFDKVLRTSERHIIPILKKGHARNQILAGNQSSKKIDFSVHDVIDGTPEIKFSILNDFIQLLESTSQRMIRQPSGCFEQVSSSNYPNLLALKVLQNSTNFNGSDLINKIQTGYGKLVAYETPSNGFEWYGRNPPHTTLSAYGLLQFSLTRDLGLQIDEKMFSRNLKWLMDQRDGEGGFEFHKGKYGFSGSSYKTDKAYVTWVLSRISKKDLSREIDAIESDIEKTFDAYRASLLAGIYANRNETAKAQIWMNRLEEHFNKKKFTGFKTAGSIMYSGGKALNVEVMSLALLAAYQLDNQPNAFANQLIEHIMESQTNYGFGNTQSTALALEALSNYVDHFASKNKNQMYTVWLDGNKIMELSNNGARHKNLVLSEDLIKSGAHTLWVECGDGKQLPYTCELAWLEQIDKVEHEELVLDYKFNRTDATMSDEVLATINITNKTDQDKPQTVAVIHIPAGLSYSMEELRFLKKEGVFDYFESQNDELVFYFLGLKANATKQVTLSLKPNILGRFSPAESYVYQYYTPEIRSTILAKPLFIKPDLKP
jgi:alpha-2-macroglobulin-like protein